MYSKILGTGSYLPSQIRTNADLEKMVDTTDEWIVTRTGIKERRIAAEDETVADMGYEASLKAIEMAGIDKKENHLVIFSTKRSSHPVSSRSGENTSGIPSHKEIVCRLLLVKKKKTNSY